MLDLKKPPNLKIVPSELTRHNNLSSYSVKSHEKGKRAKGKRSFGLKVERNTIFLLRVGLAAVGVARTR